MKKAIIITLGIFTFAFIITAAVLLLSGPRMDNQPSLRAYEAQVNLPPEDVVAFFETKNDLVLTAMPANNKGNIEKGKIYYGYYCVFCHGDDGKGNGPVGESFHPKPADLSNPQIIRYDSIQLYNATFKGIHAPVLERVIPPAYRQYILLYIKNSFTNNLSR